jgi:hypothetical protein
MSLKYKDSKTKKALREISEGLDKVAKDELKE